MRTLLITLFTIVWVFWSFMMFVHNSTFIGISNVIIVVANCIIGVYNSVNEFNKYFDKDRA